MKELFQMEELDGSEKNTDFQFYPWEYYVKNGSADPNKDFCVAKYFGQKIIHDQHWHDFFTIAFIEKDSHGIQIDGKELKGLDGKVVLMRPRTVHAFLWNPDKPPLYIFLLRETFIKRKLLQFIADCPAFVDFFLGGILKGKSEYMVIDVGGDTTIFELVKNMCEMNQSSVSGTDSVQKIIEAQFFLVLMYLCRFCDRETTVQNKSFPVEQIFLYIISHCNDVSMADLTREFAYHPNYIAENLHKTFGMTFIEIKQKAQIKNACNLLTCTSYPVQIIAGIVGFENTQYFYRVFKKYMGVTPKEYRKAENSMNDRCLPLENDKALHKSDHPCRRKESDQ